jgi:Zn-finger nucleic acid-binding protein
MDMTCPKCSGPMRTYERNGVHVDQCTDCRGIFLDRGELERLIDAENSWHGQQPSGGGAAAAGPAVGGAGLGAVVNEVLGQVRGSKQPRYEDRSYEERRYEDRRYDEYGRSYGSSHPRRKKSFLSELFD